MTDGDVSMRSILTACLGAVLGIALMVMPNAAEARWLRAESPRFIVYSDGDEATLRRQVQNLERFDRLLRGIHGLDLDAVPPRKLEIYLIRSSRDMDLLRPGWGDFVAGYYSASSEDIYAVGIRERRDDSTLLHEYVHHFMLQYFNDAYPAWLVEGYAEYFGETEFEANRITFGRPLNSRGYSLLSGDWLPLDEVVGRARPERVNLETMDLFYAQSWAITHWFMSDEARRARLMVYMRQIALGADPIPTFERAAGMPLDQFARELRRYVGGRLTFSSAPASSFVTEPVEIAQLSASADALLLLNQRQKGGGLDDDDLAETLQLIQRAARPLGEDRLALLTLGHAELHIGDPAEGERLLTRLLELEPDNVEALQLIASRRYTQATEATETTDRSRLLREGNAFLARALQANPEDYRTYYWLAMNRSGQSSYPNDNDILTWGHAFRLAPQLDEIRLGMVAP